MSKIGQLNLSTGVNMGLKLLLKFIGDFDITGREAVFVVLKHATTTEIMRVTTNSIFMDLAVNGSDVDLIFAIIGTTPNEGSGSAVVWDDIGPGSFDYFIDIGKPLEDTELRLQNGFSILDTSSPSNGQPSTKTITIGDDSAVVSVAGQIVTTAGSPVNWGEIQGNIPDQTDLQDALDDKLDVVLPAINTQDLVTAVVLGTRIYNGDPINNMVRFDLPDPALALGQIFTFNNVDTTPGLSTNFMSIRPTVGTINGSINDWVLSRVHEYVAFYAHTTTNYISVLQRSFGVASLSISAPVLGENITTTPAKLEIFDQSVVSSPGRVTADVANDQIDVLFLAEIQDGYQVQLSIDYEYSNNVEVTAEVRYNGVVLARGESTGRGNNNTVALSIGRLIGINIAPASFEIFISASAGGSIDYLSCGFFVTRIGG